MKRESLPFLSSPLFVSSPLVCVLLEYAFIFFFHTNVEMTLRKPIKFSGKNLPRQTVVLPLEMLLLDQTKLFSSAVISL